MRAAFLVGCLAVLAAATSPTKTKRAPGDQFVSTSGTKFQVNGSDFPFIGTTAYWLATLDSEEDMNKTFASIKQAGIKVVRTWAFNDVEAVPENGTWFQLVANGTTTVNDGPNGLAKLDSVVRAAEANGIYLLMTLTNNWNPRPLFDNLTASIENLTDTVSDPSIVRRDVTPGTNNSLPRNTLSNDYGGMDVYVRQYGLSNHDEFYTNTTIIEAFENATRAIVERYVDSPAIFSWEIANDPRCNSTVTASSTCNPHTITRWLDRVSRFIKEVDENHLVTSGAQGFLCQNCEKLFPTPTATPGPGPSPAPGQVRRRAVNPFSVTKMLQERKATMKKRVAAVKRTLTGEGSGIRIRGKWVSTPTKRQEEVVNFGPAYDGSQGVDSEDIINIPAIGFGTFQLFPDQNDFGHNDDPTLSKFNNTVDAGVEWINNHAEMAQLFGKPVSLTGFGLVSQRNAPFFVPFNSTIAPYGPDQNPGGVVQPYGVTDDELLQAYERWFAAGISGGLQGIIQYQWGQSNLTAVEGSSISTDPTLGNNTQSSVNNTNGISPNDGYSIQGFQSDSVQQVISEAAQAIGT